MKRTVLLFLATSLCFADGPENPAVTESEMSAATESPSDTANASPAEDESPSDSGIAAAQSSQTGRVGSWQNWIVAGGAVVAGAICAIIVSMDQGSSAH